MTKEERRRRHLEGQRTEQLRAKRSGITRGLMADPNRRARIAAAMKALWEDPEYRKRVMANRPKGPRIKDGLTKTERYRLKDVDAYRKRKRDYAKTADERRKRTLYQQKWREQNRAKHNASARASHQRNKHKHVAKRRDEHYQREYGISHAEKLAMVERQQGCCGICGKPFRNSRSTHLDHCHRTGTIRGVLCHVCNTKLEWFETYRATIVSYIDR